MNEWFVVYRERDLLKIAAFPDRYEAKHLAQSKTHELREPYSISPCSEPLTSAEIAQENLRALYDPELLDFIHTAALEEYDRLRERERLRLIRADMDDAPMEELEAAAEILDHRV